MSNISRRTFAAFAFTAAVFGATTASAQAVKEIRLDFATYNPVSLLLKERGLLEKEFAADGISIRWVQSAGSNKALEFLNASSIDFGSTAGSAALLAKVNGNPIKSVYVYSRPEWTALVTTEKSGIKTVADLKGKRVSIDEPGSGSIINARSILASFGLGNNDYRAEFLKAAPSMDKIKDGSLDAFFMTTGYPAGALSEMAATHGFELLPIEGQLAADLKKRFTFFADDVIPDGAYKDVKGVNTLAVGAQWVTSAKIDADLVYEVTKGLWSDKTRAALDSGHAKGKSIQRTTALAGLGIPLHPGAERFYKEAGLIKA
jgi:uncharacterized protein